MDKVRPGGYILADNVLGSGKAGSDTPGQTDRQTEAIMEVNKKTASDPRVRRLIRPIRDGLAVLYKIR